MPSRKLLRPGSRLYGLATFAAVSVIVSVAVVAPPADWA
jgi:hypothetical protein